MNLIIGLVLTIAFIFVNQIQSVNAVKAVQQGDITYESLAVLETAALLANPQCTCTCDVPSCATPKTSKPVVSPTFAPSFSVTAPPTESPTAVNTISIPAARPTRRPTLTPTV
jgi:hypothetical protein